MMSLEVISIVLAFFTDCLEWDPVSENFPTYFGKLFGTNDHRDKINRIHNLTQTEKSQLEGKRTMPETRFNEFLALSVDPRVGISRSAMETDV